MNTYDIQRAREKRRNAWIAAGILVLSLIAWLGSYPQPYNAFAQWVEDVTPLALLQIPEAPLTLGLDLQGGVHLTYTADMSNIADADKTAALEGVRDVIERRVNAFGVGEPIVQSTSANGYRVIVDLPGITNASEAVAQIGETPVLEFKVPKENVSADPTDEQLAEVDAAQETERAAALAVLDEALVKGADFSALAKQHSIDTFTKESNGYVGFVTTDDPEYGGLADRIASDRLRTGVIDGLYEGTSRMHIVKYLSSKNETEVQASHILICYIGAKGCTGSMSRDEARTLAEQVQDEAMTSNFADLATQYSTDPGSGGQGGDLGWVKEGEMVEPFGSTLFGLSDGKISEVVETDFGYHVIYREDSRMVQAYELAHIEMPWTTVSDVVDVDPWENTQLSGEHIQSAAVAIDQASGKPFVSLEFNEEGAQLFADLTEANVGDVIGIFLDGEPITTPVVQQAIYGGQASITGSFTTTEAKLLAQRLTAGALPVPISLDSQQTIGPALGLASLNQSVAAGLIGFVLIAVFMILYYRLPGLFATVALAIYAGLNLTLYKVFGVTLTLAGIAGLVLSMGIAVDANVLVYERLKEELRAGRDLPSALEEAYRRAWTSIRDGNGTTLIATLVLYFMSTGFIRGFALTLTIGVLLSMFTALTVTRGMLRLVVRKQSLRKKIFFLGL
jgi:protein-export membrane protein SecD